MHESPPRAPKSRPRPLSHCVAPAGAGATRSVHVDETIASHVCRNRPQDTEGISRYHHRTLPRHSLDGKAAHVLTHDVAAHFVDVFPPHLGSAACGVLWDKVDARLAQLPRPGPGKRSLQQVATGRELCLRVKRTRGARRDHASAPGDRRYCSTGPWHRRQPPGRTRASAGDARRERARGWRADTPCCRRSRR